MAVKIQFRRDTASNWNGVPTTVLASGEVGYESDTGNIKIGDGITQWQNLAYYQLPNISVNPATSSDLNATNYRVMGRYRLNTVTSGTTLTNGPSDLDTADADSVCTLLVTTHAYASLTTHVQQTLTQFSASATSLKQWVRLYNGTNWTAWTSTAHLSDGEVTTAKIANDAVTADKLADDVSTDGNRAVTTNHIRDSAVTTAKIADSNVTTAKIADSNVTFAKLPNSAAAGLSVIGRSASSAGVFAEIASANADDVLRRSGATIGFGTIASAGIADSAVTTAKIADNNVTYAKFAPSTATPYPIGSGNGSAGVGAFCTLRTNSATAGMTCNALSGLTLTGNWLFFGVKFGGSGAFGGTSDDVRMFLGTGTSTGFATAAGERVAGWGIRLS